MALTSIGSIVLAHDQELQGRLLDSALSQFPVVGTQISRNVGVDRGLGTRGGRGHRARTLGGDRWCPIGAGGDGHGLGRARDASVPPLRSRSPEPS